MFLQMGILIEQQDVTVKAIVDRSNEVKEDTEAAYAFLISLSP